MDTILRIEQIATDLLSRSWRHEHRRTHRKSVRTNRRQYLDATSTPPFQKYVCSGVAGTAIRIKNVRDDSDGLEFRTCRTVTAGDYSVVAQFELDVRAPTV